MPDVYLYPAETNPFDVRLRDPTVADSGGSTGVLTGASAFAFSPAGTLTGTGALSGASTLTFSPAATLTGTGALSGSATLTFSPAGTLTGAGALSGATSLTFTPTGVLTGTGALTGAASLTFAPAGSLTGTGALAGASSLTFSPAGTLTDAGGGAQPEPDPYPKPAGRAAKKKRRYEVEIDGQIFEVDSVQHAQALLDRAREMAVTRAPIVAESVVVRRIGSKPPKGKPIRVPTPQLWTPDTELIAVVARARTDIAKIYRDAAIAAEISFRLQSRLIEEDDEDVLLFS